MVVDFGRWKEQGAQWCAYSQVDMYRPQLSVKSVEHQLHSQLAVVCGMIRLTTAFTVKQVDCLPYGSVISLMSMISRRASRLLFAPRILVGFVKQHNSFCSFYGLWPENRGNLAD